MSEYIKREDVLSILASKGAAWDAYNKVQQLPAADVVERKHGEWEDIEVEYLDKMSIQPDSIASMFCPICKRYANSVHFYGDPTYMMNYCPNCGARMDGGE